MLPWIDGDTHVEGDAARGPWGHSGPGSPSHPGACGRPVSGGPPQPPGRGREACLAGPPPPPTTTKSPALYQEGRSLGQQQSVKAVDVTGVWPSRACADPCLEAREFQSALLGEFYFFFFVCAKFSMSLDFHFLSRWRSKGPKLPSYQKQQKNLEKVF